MEQSMPVSLLGLSFLGRLDGYSISDGVLTIEW
jgi:predicted aspartyl protease